MNLNNSSYSWIVKSIISNCNVSLRWTYIHLGHKEFRYSIDTKSNWLQHVSSCLTKWKKKNIWKFGNRHVTKLSLRACNTTTFPSLSCISKSSLGGKFLRVLLSRLVIRESIRLLVESSQNQKIGWRESNWLYYRYLKTIFYAIKWRKSSIRAI